MTATLNDLVSGLEGLAANGYVLAALGRNGAGTYSRPVGAASQMSSLSTTPAPTLGAIGRVWRRPVILSTTVGGKQKVFRGRL